MLLNFWPLFLLIICLLVSAADNLYKQFGSRSGPTKRRAWSGCELFDTPKVFQNYFVKCNDRVDDTKHAQVQDLVGKEYTTNKNGKWTVRGITCISYNIYHLKKLKMCLFINDFKVRRSKVTYLGYIKKNLRQGQILGRQTYNLFKLRISLLSDLQWPCVQISRRCVHKFIA